MFRSRWFAPLLLVLLTGLVACEETTAPGEDEEELGHPPAAMVASWTFQSVTENGSAAQLSDALEWLTGTVEARLHIQANGPYVYEEVDTNGGQLFAESGWVFVDEEGPTIEFHALQDSEGPVNEETTVFYTLSGNSMTLEQTVGASTFIYSLTR